MTYPLPDSGPTKALQSGSAKTLRESLLKAVNTGIDEWVKDYRDLMMALAPYHDCARRLGQDPQILFEEVAASCPPEVAEVVWRFGCRTDITPEGFGFFVEDNAYLRPGEPMTMEEVRQIQRWISRGR
jgi:hypothetical protein